MCPVSNPPQLSTCYGDLGQNQTLTVMLAVSSQNPSGVHHGLLVLQGLRTRQSIALHQLFHPPEGMCFFNAPFLQALRLNTMPLFVFRQIGSTGQMVTMWVKHQDAPSGCSSCLFPVPFLLWCGLASLIAMAGALWEKQILVWTVEYRPS